jgi:hypothetical protein
MVIRKTKFRVPTGPTQSSAKSSVPCQCAQRKTDWTRFLQLWLLCRQDSSMGHRMKDPHGLSYAVTRDVPTLSVSDTATLASHRGPQIVAEPMMGVFLATMDFSGFAVLSVPRPAPAPRRPQTFHPRRSPSQGPFPSYLFLDALSI